MSIQEPLISIIVPVYNKVRYLEKTLQLIADQSFTNFECILIDDGSTDGSQKICEEFSQKDCRFRAIHTANSGVSHARNVGLDAARGEFITFIDADDEVKKEYLENLYQCIISNSVDLVISWHSQLLPSGEINNRSFPLLAQKYYLQDILPSFCKMQMESGIFGWCWAKIFRKDLIKSIRFNEDIRLAEDFDFYLNLYSKIDTVFFDDKTLYLYRLGADNSSVAVNDRDIDYFAQLRINLHYREFLRQREVWSDENKNIVECRLSNYAFYCLFHCPIEEFDTRFELLHKTCKEESIPLKGTRLFQKIMLMSLKNNHKKISKKSLEMYYRIRSIVKKHST